MNADKDVAAQALTQFKRDTAQHEMKIVLDDDVTRFVRFFEPGTNCYYFDIVTWPGCLCIQGDCGTYVFQRTQDMFEFFRQSASNKSIDFRYWAEKVKASEKDGGIKKFDEAKFAAAVKEYFDQHFEEEVSVAESMKKEAEEDGCVLDPDTLQVLIDEAKERADLWAEIENEVLSYGNDSHESFAALFSVSHEGNSFFQDWEDSCEEYTHSFLWCCYAIQYAIRKYDESKVGGGIPVMPGVDPETVKLSKGIQNSKEFTAEDAHTAFSNVGGTKEPT